MKSERRANGTSLIVDASAAVDFLLARRNAAVLGRRLEEADSLHAPHLIDLEVASSLRRLTAAGHVSNDRARAALGDFREIALVRYPATALLDRIWQLRRTLTPYDAIYVALAEALHAPLLTSDERLGRSHGHAADIVVVPQ